MKPFLNGILFFTWMLPLNLIGLALLMLAKLFGQVEYWHSLSDPPYAFVVKLDGFVSRFLGKERNGSVLYAQTVGCFMFFYWPPDAQKLKHESTHVTQQLYWGPLQPVIYVLSVLWGLVRYRSFYQAYRNVIWERLARKAAGES